jgi:hypothetical protein
MRLAVAVGVVIACCAVPAHAVTVTVGRQDLSPTVPQDFNHRAGCLSTNSTPCIITVSPGELTNPSDLELVPADGTITGWRAKGGNNGFSATTSFRLRVLRRSGDSWTGAGSSPTVDKTAMNGSLITLAAPLPVLAGDRIAVTVTHTESLDTSMGWVDKQPVMGAFYDTFGPIADGTSESPTRVDGAEPLLNADVVLAPPEVTGVSPSSGPTAGGQQVTIYGNHLDGATSVTFGGQQASSVNLAPDRSLTVVTPASPPGTVDVTVTTAGGQSPASPAARYTFVAPPTDETSPVISALKLSPSSFEAANTGPALIAAVVGTRLSYALSEAGTTTFTVERARPGFRRGHRCVKRRPAGRARRCTRYVRMKGKLTHVGAAGTNSVRFMGRLRNRRLHSGRYRLVAVATDAAGNRSKPVRRGFRILRPSEG